MGLSIGMIDLVELNPRFTVIALTVGDLLQLSRRSNDLIWLLSLI